VNKRYAGFSDKSTFSKRDFFLHDEIPHSENAKVFDIDKHSLDHLQNISYQQARERNRPSLSLACVNLSY
jgi:hypothetical protein